MRMKKRIFFKKKQKRKKTDEKRILCKFTLKLHVEQDQSFFLWKQVVSPNATWQSVSHNPFLLVQNARTH